MEVSVVRDSQNGYSRTDDNTHTHDNTRTEDVRTHTQQHTNTKQDSQTHTQPHTYKPDSCIISRPMACPSYLNFFNLTSETRRLRQQYNNECMSETPSPRLQFEYACLLSCSPSRSDLRDALEMFHELLEIGYNQSNCLYQLAMAHLKLGEYYLAKRRVEMLIRMEPRNLAALSLHSLIVDRTAYDGIGGAVLLCAVAGFLFFMIKNWNRPAPATT